MARGLLVAVGIALIAGSCGSASPAPSYDGSSSIAELIGRPEPDELRSRVDAAQRREQEFISACMRRLGFEYVAWVDPSLLPSPTPLEYAGLTSREIAERFGWGISTLEPPAVEHVPDPNDAYVQTLDEATAEAYIEALRGAPSIGDGGVLFYEVGFAAVGADNCQQRAFEAGFENGLPDLDRLALLEELLDDLTLQVESHPDVVQAREERNCCLRDAGVGAPHGEEPSARRQWLDDTRGLGIEDPTWSGLRELHGSGLIERHVWAAVQEMERSLATIELRCAEPYQDVSEGVQSILERRFLDEHYALLVEVKDGL